MKKQTILTATQQLFLHLFSKGSICRQFYLSGGTALAQYYIPYRQSEDLDFFNEREFEIEPIIVFLKSIKKELTYQQFSYNNSFNRNIFFLHFKKETLKIEFTYFPFTQIEKPKEVDKLLVDSVTDIAVNKLFTIYQKARSRDFMDLYLIMSRFGFTIEGLIAQAKIKFDWYIDLLRLGAQFLLVKEVKDYPRLLIPLDEKLWQDYFLNEAKKFGKKIIV